MTIFDTVTSLCKELRPIEKRESEIWTAQSPLIASIRAEIENAFGKASLECFTDTLLAKPGNRYLQFNHTCNPVGRFSMAIVNLRQDDNEVVAWKLENLLPVHLGAIDANTFRYAHTVYSDNEPSNQTWRARSKLTLPLNGAIANHALGARLIALAERLLDDNRVVQLELFDNEMFALLLKREDVKHRAETLAETEYDRDLLAVLNEENAGLAELIRTMDFTFDEADRPPADFRAQYNAIRSGLNRLPLSDATILFVAHAGCYWNHAIRYLVRHPTLALQAAA